MAKRTKGSVSDRKSKAPGSSIPLLWGVIHLPPLPGAPRVAAGSTPTEALARAGLRAVQEAKMLEAAGFEGIILENFGDIPFYKDSVPPETVAALAILAAAIREVVSVPLAINVLRNDARSALAIAAVTGCEFIRVNVLSGAAATDQGLIEGAASELLRERARLGAEVRILADAHVKHAKSLSSDSIELQIEELALRAGADAVIVTGATTGREVDPLHLEAAGRAARHAGVPLLIGSGATTENLARLREHATGVIVGSALRKGGQAGAELEAARCRALVLAFKASLKRTLKKPFKKPLKKSAQSPAKPAQRKSPKPKRRS